MEAPSPSDAHWFDRCTTPLNACSLETFDCQHTARSDSSDQEGGTSDDVPLVIGCYQLNERAATAQSGDDPCGDNQDASSCRSGELRLHMIGPSELSFGNEPVDIIPMESGVLDGKWRRKPARDGEAAIFASACASGRIHLHTLKKDEKWSLSPAASTCDESNEDGASICLALAWNDVVNADEEDGDRIVASYSNGAVALHDVGEVNGSIHVNESIRWKAHSMFGCPSEVWTCSFLRGSRSVVLSGADDCTLKLWDIRETQRPVNKIGEEEFEAGVTAISPHPSLDHIFAAGSYDEHVRIFDDRKLHEPLSKVHVGGGVWRIKWHPSCWKRGGSRQHFGKMLVAAMHGGCRLVEAAALLEIESDETTIISKFTAHESMAYGSDWVSADAVASCSFYDRQVFLWDPYRVQS